MITIRQCFINIDQSIIVYKDTGGIKTCSEYARGYFLSVRPAGAWFNGTEFLQHHKSERLDLYARLQVVLIRSSLDRSVLHEMNKNNSPSWAYGRNPPSPSATFTVLQYSGEHEKIKCYLFHWQCHHERK